MTILLSQTISVRSQITVVNSLELSAEPVNNIHRGQISMVSVSIMMYLSIALRIEPVCELK